MRKPQSMDPTSEGISSSHLDRKTLKRPDSFTVVVTQLLADLFQNTRILLIILGLLILSGVGFSWRLSQKEAQSRQAMNVLYEAEKTLEDETQKNFPSEGSQPSKGSALQAEAKKTGNRGEFLAADVAAKLPKSLAKLQEVAEKYASTRAGFEAQMQLGSLYFDHGQYDQALKWFTQADTKGSERLDRASASSAIGYAYAAQGKWTEALASYQKAISAGEASMKGDLLLSIARCYEGLHDSAKARSIYDQITKEFPGGEYAKQAEILKSRL